MKQHWLTALIMWRKFINFMGLLFMTGLLIAFVMWCFITGFPPKEKVDPGYKIAPTEKELREIEFGP